jgi:hypothetical protein
MRASSERDCVEWSEEERDLEMGDANLLIVKRKLKVTKMTNLQDWFSHMHV